MRNKFSFKIYSFCLTSRNVLNDFCWMIPNCGIDFFGFKIFGWSWKQPFIEMDTCCVHKHFLHNNQDFISLWLTILTNCTVLQIHSSIRLVLKSVMQLEKPKHSLSFLQYKTTNNLNYEMTWLRNNVHSKSENVL